MALPSNTRHYLQALLPRLWRDQLSKALRYPMACAIPDCSRPLIRVMSQDRRGWL